jgi:hypothetical protein
VAGCWVREDMRMGGDRRSCYKIKVPSPPLFHE